MIPFNPDDATTPPKPKPKAMKFLNQKQVLILLETAKAIKDRNYALYYLALVTGMRQGELLALKWDNLDLEAGILNVRFNLRRRPGGGLVLDRLKTQSSIRAIKLGQETINVLGDNKERVLAEKEEKAELWQDYGFVFPSTVGSPLDPSNVLKQFRKLLVEANLPKIRFHDLRKRLKTCQLEKNRANLPNDQIQTSLPG
jgi:integrase